MSKRIRNESMEVKQDVQTFQVIYQDRVYTCTVSGKAWKRGDVKQVFHMIKQMSKRDERSAW